MPDRKPHHMPESLLWLSNELYWRQNLAPLPGVPAKPQQIACEPRRNPPASEAVGAA